MREMSVDATVENIDKITQFVDEQLQTFGCIEKIQSQINIAIDELISNIAYYAYHPEIGPVTVQIDVREQPLCVEITFIDHGVPYDPLKKEDPDTTLSADERDVGGLGIFMVKQMMDDVSYEYREGKNILTIKKQA